jgi:hypothetical protein
VPDLIAERCREAATSFKVRTGLLFEELRGMNKEQLTLHIEIWRGNP